MLASAKSTGFLLLFFVLSIEKGLHTTWDKTVLIRSIYSLKPLALPADPHAHFVGIINTSDKYNYNIVLKKQLVN